MMNKKYNIELDGKRIGFSFLEKADAPMGVVFGKIYPEGILLDYNFLHNYCKNAGITLGTDYPEDRLIGTMDIKGLKVFSNEGKEIKGVGTSINGMDSEGYEIEIVGIPYPFYEEEFPLHVKNYHDQFNK